MSDDDDDREGNPFENLDPPAERDGDPFENLDAPTDDEPDGADAAGTDDPIDATDQPGPDSGDRALDPSDVVDESSAPAADPFAEGDLGTDGQADPLGDASGDPTDEPSDESFTESDDPFAAVGDRGDPFEGGESAFERVDVGDVDADQVWAEITDDGETETPEAPRGSRYADVSKHRFCEQCPHFSGPPDVHCGHEGTEIVEFVDMETVRLLDCPIVAEQRELDGEG